MKSKREATKSSSGSATGTSNDERRARGLERIAGIWLPAELVAALDTEVEAIGSSRTALIDQALRKLLKARLAAK